MELAGVTTKLVATLAKHMTDEERREAAAELRTLGVDDKTRKFFATTADGIEQLTRDEQGQTSN